MNGVKISIIIATYNRGESLVRTLHSVAAQTLPPQQWEVVVVNNNSSDNTSELFNEFVTSHSGLNIRMVDEAVQGLSPARNRGIAESYGELIAIIDDDQEVNDGFAAAYCEFFDTHPAVAAGGGIITPLYEFPTPGWLSPYAERPIAGTLYMGSKAKEFQGKKYPGGGNMALRRTLFDHYKPFNPELGRTGTKLLGGEEKDLFHRLRLGGEQIWYVPQAVVYHIIPESKLSTEYFLRLSRMVGVSERVRTLGVSRSEYVKRVISECIKWVATSALMVLYTLQGKPLKGWYLVKMRHQITLGLIKK